MRSTRGGAVLLAALALASSMACGRKKVADNSSTGNPVAPSTQTGCRTYPTAATITTTIGNNTQTAFMTGLFNASTRTSTITSVLANGNTCSTSVSSYSSVADFVDEVRVIPGVSLQTSTTNTNGAGCGGSTATVQYTYDAQKRLVSFGSGGSLTTYSAWDSAGRPTLGGFPGTTIANAYDDATRTWVQTQTQTAGGSPSTTTTTFDANGNQLKVVTLSGNTTITTTYATSSTARVCK